MKSATAKAELVPYLSRPALARLMTALRSRFEQLGRVGGEVRLSAATPEERRAVADLLGLAKLPPQELRVSLAAVDQALRSSGFAVDLPSALTHLGGALRNLPEERQQRRNEKLGLLAAAREHPLLQAQPMLEPWLAEIARSGLVARTALRVDPTSRTLTTALDVLAILLPKPAEPTPRRLAVLANQALGRSHGLDAGEPVATLVISALAYLRNVRHPRTSAERRETWEWVGVVADDLSCDVLVAGLAPEGSGPVAQVLRLLAETGEPVRLTLRQVVGLEAVLWPAEMVHVCENPAVVALVADRLGPRAPPIVCTSGMPNQAVRVLLGQLRQAGAEFSYHGDFDWLGLTIANTLWRDFGFRPWRFSAADYEQALALPGERWPLAGEPVAAAWDPTLTAAMQRGGRAIEEEALIELLLADLGH